jgi:hypothetical protein
MSRKQRLPPRRIRHAIHETSTYLEKPNTPLSSQNFLQSVNRLELFPGRIIHGIQGLSVRGDLANEKQHAGRQIFALPHNAAISPASIAKKTGS